MLKSDAKTFVDCINKDVKKPVSTPQPPITFFRTPPNASYLSCQRCGTGADTLQLNQNQFDALVSFTYNLGCGNLENIAAKINNDGFEAATSSMKEYTHAGGKVLEGLVTRRKKEVEMFDS